MLAALSSALALTTPLRPALTTPRRSSPRCPTLVIFGTYPADFNMIEYAQKMRHYWPQLKAKGVDSGLIVVNGSPDSCKRLAEILDLPADVELLSDEAGEAGRLFGVSTGWLPDSDLNPYLKLLGMLG